MTFDNFADILVMSRVIAPEAISDPDKYDDSCGLENVKAAYRRLTTPTADKVVPWLASQTDVLADDWLVESPEAGG